MHITRRYILALMAGLPAAGGQTAFDIDRLLDETSTGRGNDDCRREVRRYVANATVTVFSIPLISKSGVGSGYAVVEEANRGDGKTLSIQFGAGSFPQSARGLNRLGFIQEAVAENPPGRPSEFGWLAFMTTSGEKNLDQAKKALETAGSTIPYTGSQGHGRDGAFASHVERLEFPRRYTWRDIAYLMAGARTAMSAVAGEPQLVHADTSEAPATFLYLVRRAMLDASPITRGLVVFNGKQFRLEGHKEKDDVATAHFAEKKLLPRDACVMRIDALLTEKRTGDKTPFRLWYERDAERSLPLRFEYQAKSFLRLTFEADPNADTPRVRFVFKTSREDA
jgi:hypothetical protein